jgi:hypothetical protein
VNPATAANLAGQAIGALSGTPRARTGVYAGLAQSGLQGMGHTREEAEQIVLVALDSHQRAPLLGAAIGGIAGLVTMFAVHKYTRS